ncbi:hypothetical protein D9758_009972 [Tetrapyrgos nigripes]|uniref:Extracellular metalloproteinase n=1 Tax=Tetrapyrgos nigripes TaxID=182062 RepID=A0A8H5CQR7_9AGAR|nr:hypothetical protein D9758_009972 [Tetrapyrgos nigripes]
MARFNKVFASVLLAVVYASTTLAAPWATFSKHATHRRRLISSDLQIETFHPASTFETFDQGIDHPLSKREDASLDEMAIAFVASHLGLDANDLEIKSSYAADVTSHAYLKQKHEGIPFANAVANVAIKSNKVVSLGSSFTKPNKIASSSPTVVVEDAISTAEQALSGTYNQHPTTLEYLLKDDGSAVLSHVIQIQNEEAFTWHEAFVDAHTGELVSVTDFVASATYLVLPIEKQNITQGFETLTDPQNTASSPQGWHSNGTTSTTDTSGNNVIAYKGPQTNTTQESSSELNFIYTQDPSVSPTTTGNVNAARVNAFYLGNTLHDIWYQYGFTESAFNFQQNNFGKGGAGNDRVQISVQDPSGTNNANFATPPDGQPGQMRMFLFNLTTPGRDGVLENDIPVHEYTHGLTNRMTGGGTGRCLQSTEAGGMGEGWSDAMAEWTEQTSAEILDCVIGTYVVDKPAGIRSHPYSTSASVNPLRYSSLQILDEIHNIGEVWANMLHNVYAALVGVHGFSPNAKTDTTGSEGNVVYLHLFMDALALQPCNPTFLTARDAWIQADQNRYDGANNCTLWKAFASRGLGVNAANYRDDSTVPSGC